MSTSSRTSPAMEDQAADRAPRPAALGFWQRAVRSPSCLTGSVLLLTLVGLAVCAPALTRYDPNAQNLQNVLTPPSASHWFGTDQLGRDGFSRVLYAARTDLRVAAVAAATPFVIGVALGVVAGFLGGVADWLIGRVLETVIAFPFYVIVVALVFALGVGERGIYAAFAIVGWVGYARVMRASARALRSSPWVESAYGGGLSIMRVLAHHVMPNVLPQAIVLLMNEILLIMVAVVTLGYLGLGVQPPTPDWGTMISESQNVITTKWWLGVIPGAALVYTGIGLSLLGDGLGDAWRIA